MTGNEYGALYALLALAIVVLAFNQYQLATINLKGSTGPPLSGNVIAKPQQAQQPSNADMQSILDKVMPKGIPEIYGSELKVSFDNPVGGLDILGNLDADLNPGKGGIKFDELTDGQKQRYMKVGFSIACEFCCGATSLIDSKGMPACGCAHSAAMRGLAKYLLKNHESQYTDEQILDQLTKWKTLFFPQQMVAKYMKVNGLTGSSSLPGMVGGCG